MDMPGRFAENDDFAGEEFDLTEDEFDARFAAAERVTVVGLPARSDTGRVLTDYYVSSVSKGGVVPTSGRVTRGGHDVRPDYSIPVTSSK